MVSRFLHLVSFGRSKPLPYHFWKILSLWVGNVRSCWKGVYGRFPKETPKYFFYCDGSCYRSKRSFCGAFFQKATVFPFLKLGIHNQAFRPLSLMKTLFQCRFWKKTIYPSLFSKAYNSYRVFMSGAKRNRTAKQRRRRNLGGQENKKFPTKSVGEGQCLHSKLEM